MVRFVSPNNYDSSIGNAITQAAQTLYGPEKLKGALAQAQLEKARRENASAIDFAKAIYSWGNSAATNPAQPVAPQQPDAPAAAPADHSAFLGAIAPAAIETAKRLGVDPRLVVAQTALETGWGKSAPNNNYFGIKAPHGGGAVLPTTEYQNGQPVSVADAFQKYDSPAASVAGYGHLLSLPRYAGVRAAPDLNGQIAAMGDSGYATDPNYAAKLAAIAHGLDLSKFLPAPAPSPQTGAPDMQPGRYNPNNTAQNTAQLLATGVMSGQNPSAVSDLIRAFTGNVYGAENQATTNAAVAAGQPYGSTYAGFADAANQKERQNLRASDNSRYATDTSAATQMATDGQKVISVLRNGVPTPILKKDLLPTDKVLLTDTQNKALTAQGMDMTSAQKLAYVGATPKSPAQAHRFYSPSEQKTIPSYDGVNGVDGTPLPSDAVQVSVVSPSLAGAGLTNSNRTKVEAQVYGLENFRNTLNNARGLASDPTIFGISGKLQRLGLNLTQQWSQIKQNFPEQAKALEDANAGMLANIMSAAKSDDPNGVFSNFIANKYNPNLAGLDLYAQLLPYEAAAVFSGQTGRSVSDKDVKRWENAVGDPTSLFSSQEKFVAHLDMLDRLAQQEIHNAKSTLVNGVDAQNNPPPPESAIPRQATAAPANAPQGVPTVESAKTMTAKQIGDLQDVNSLPPDVLDAVIARAHELGLK